MNGLDAQRTRYDTQDRFRRHHRKTILGIKHTEVARPDAVAQYRQRAQEEYGFEVRVWDVGQFAGHTSGACFWLSLAAGLAEISGDVLAQALPGDHPACAFLAEVRVCGIASAMKGVARTSPLGLCAEALRSYFCAGPDAVLLKPNIRAKLYPAFAALGNNGPARTEAMYKQWVEKLEMKEYVDELVLLAVALVLPVRLVVIPYTPPSCERPWVIISHGAPGIGLDGARTIHLGNDDVHYAYLSRGTH